jgi:hypothetical protein
LNEVNDDPYDLNCIHELFFIIMLCNLRLSFLLSVVAYQIKRIK